MSGNKPLTARTIQTLLAQRGLAPHKSLGQNFLVDPHILERIAGAAALGPADLVLEVGPGLGALTDFLLDQAGMVVAVEYDRGLYRYLQERYPDHPKLLLLNQDILEVDLVSLLANHPTYRPKAVANLPYCITTPVLFKLIESGINWGSLVVLVQKELGQRLVAQPGGKTYGALTVMLNFYGRVEALDRVARTVFYPSPQVDSVLVRITPHARPNPISQQQLHVVVQAAFGQRRKTILNALAAAGRFGTKSELEELLKHQGIDPGRRGETLTVPEFISLAQTLAGPDYKKG